MRLLSDESMRRPTTPFYEGRYLLVSVTALLSGASWPFRGTYKSVLREAVDSRAVPLSVARIEARRWFAGSAIAMQLAM